MSFTIDDPGLDVTLDEGLEVVYQDAALGLPMFRGMIETWTLRPSGLGRRIAVTATGIEAVLDWMIVPSLTIPGGTNVGTAIQSALANATGIGVPLRATMVEFVGSTIAHPIDGNAFFESFFTTLYDVVLDGATLRDSIQSILDAADWVSCPVSGAVRGLVTVDFYTGLRAYVYTPQFPTYPDDYGGLQVWDTAPATAGWPASQGYEHTTDAGAAVHQVYVQGSNAAGSGLVTDGTGLPGRVALLVDPTSSTAARRDAKGAGYLSEHSTVIRGQVTVELARAKIPSVGDAIRAGSSVRLENPAIVSTGIFGVTIGTIEKAASAATEEEWTVHYGGPRPSAARLIRHLTRDTRS